MAQSNLSDSLHPGDSHPPGAWPKAVKRVRRIFVPIERFLAIEAASGIVLMMSAVAALILANSPWRDLYTNLWHVQFGFRFGSVSFERDLHFWINDGLMTLFFFLVGLEIRREVHSGELGQLRRAALPLIAALGGMLIPALVFLALNVRRVTAAGWAIPMATDIAFAVGALALLGKRVTPPMRMLLLALAVIDDVGAIFVIALFYSFDIHVLGVAVLAVGVLVIFVLKILGIRSFWAYVPPSLIAWSGAYVGGIHPTLAGVIIGFLTPVEMQQVASRDAVSPVERLQHSLHGWVAFGIVPLFAFANAGISLTQISLHGDAGWLFIGVVLGLGIGKPLGVLGSSWTAARAGLIMLPGNIGWSQIRVVGTVAGVGFTMALFIAQLAFPAGLFLETAKLAIVCGSLLAGTAFIALGYRTLSLAPSTATGTEK